MANKILRIESFEGPIVSGGNAGLQSELVSAADHVQARGMRS